MMNAQVDTEPTIPHATRHDSLKTGIYTLIGFLLALILIIGTVVLFVVG